MKTEIINDIHGFSGTILIPVFETNAKSLVPIEFGGVAVASKVFYGKKDTHYLVEKYDSTHIFIGLGKNTDYKGLKTIFRRIASKQKEVFTKKIALFIPDDFTPIQVEAISAGLYCGTYNIGRFKKNEPHPFLQKDFVLFILSKKDHSEAFGKGLKIAKAQIEVFNLVDLPPNVATPQYLADWATESGKNHGFSTKVLGREAQPNI